jgi:hypothetical protein
VSIRTAAAEGGPGAGGDTHARRAVSSGLGDFGGRRGDHSRGVAARSAILANAREWADRQDPGSFSGVAIGVWRRYRAVDGPLQSALLSLYVLVAVLPAVLVMEEYLDANPSSLANQLVHHWSATSLRSAGPGSSSPSSSGRPGG